MFGIDDAIIGSLIAGGSSLLGGFMKGGQQDKANKLQIQEQQNSFINTAKQMQAMGLNPALAAGGSSSVPGVTVGDGPAEGVAGAGQDISRAIMSQADKASKADALKEQLVQAQIDKTKAETEVTRASLASRSARTFASPGTAPSSGDKPFFQEFSMPGGRTLRLPSDKASQSLQNAASAYAWPEITLRGLYENYGPTHGRWWVPEAYGVRGDVARRVQNLGIGDYPGSVGYPY